MSNIKTAKEIRREFIEFFQNKEHQFIPSWPVIPIDDPTLLFTNAGMNQFKDILLDKPKDKNFPNRAVNSQRCIRVSGKHNDLEEVGYDTYHHTFFEMLGNWSFGNYYKKEAIQWAWELLTKVWKLPKHNLYATVYKDDDEAAELWPKVTDISANRVLRFGNKDNFWEMGETGPCGPCSEIHIDLGENFCDMKNIKGHTCSVNGDCGRYIELWNLVFIQYFRDKNGKLNPLPKKHIDTGMGFERIVSVIQGVYDNYKTDCFTPIIKTIESLTSIKYKTSESKAPFHVIADHIRMLTFSIGDGGLPSNEGRGYVIRRILRRAARYGRKLNLNEPFIYKLVPTVVEQLNDAFPEINERLNFIQKVIKGEEESFNKTLDKGLLLFEQLISKLSKKNINIIPGKEVFKLYDTYGFPADLTTVLAQENNFKVDIVGFEKEMEVQKKRARKAGKFSSIEEKNEEWNILSNSENSEFIGYDFLTAETKVIKYFINDETTKIVLAKTPFYSESGGQVGDKGFLSSGKEKLEVLNTIKENNEIIHVCKNNDSFKLTNSKIKAEVNNSIRRKTMANHTATHILQATLQNILGDHVKQSGSLVDADKLRFDFTHFEKLTEEQIEKIEILVNEKIRANLKVSSRITSLKEAKKMEAMALFGEKYGDEVRVISIGDFSKELCGGTHVLYSGQIGNFVITSEASIASGIRRIEAVTGESGFKILQQSKQTSQKLSKILSCQENELEEKIKLILEDRKIQEKKISQLNQAQILGNIDKLLVKGETINLTKLIVAEFENSNIDTLKNLGDKLRVAEKKLVALIINKLSGNKINFVCAVSDELVKNNIKAGDLVKGVAKITEGGGGGRPHMATAGGNNQSKLPEAIEWLKKQL